MRHRELAAAVVAVVLSAGVAVPSGAQWREAPSGVSLRATGRTGPATFQTPATPARTRHAGLGMHVLVGMGAGAVAGTAVGLLVADGGYYCERLCEALLAGVPLGALAGAVGGFVVYAHRKPPPPQVRQEAPPAVGLGRYMTVGALAGAGVGTAASLDRCDDCTVRKGLLRNVPMGAAAGAVGGAIVYGIRHRGER